MSAAVSTIQHQPGLGSNPVSRMGTHSPVESKRSVIKAEGPLPALPPVAIQTSVLTKPERKTSISETLDENKPQSDNPSDYFSLTRPNRLDQEPNPFEQSFASGSASANNADPLATPKAILPPVTAMTSPAPLLGSASYNWGANSLRSGPLSPAMLQGPTNASSVGLGFDSHLRSGLTPNESGIRSGLTPGALFTAPSPSIPQFLFTTPGTMEFQKTAISAARKSNSQSSLISQHTTDSKSEINPSNPSQDRIKLRQSSDPFDAHTAANGLYLLAQMGGAPNTYQPAQVTSMASIQPRVTTSVDSSPNLAKRAAVNNATSVSRVVPFPSMPNHIRGVSEISNGENRSSPELDAAASSRERKRTNSKGKTASTVKRKSVGPLDNGKPSTTKRPKNMRAAMSMSDDGEPEPEDYEDDGQNDTRKDGKKMTDEEKRKNFLERNRVAALKCRQRKKQWLANLQAKVEMYGTENDALNATVQTLREEIVSLKTILLAHKDCPVARSNGVQLDIASLAASGPTDYGHVSMVPPYSSMMSSVMHQQNPGERRYS